MFLEDYSAISVKGGNYFHLLYGVEFGVVQNRIQSLLK